MISKGSCETKDWTNAENPALQSQKENIENNYGDKHSSGKMRS